MTTSENAAADHRPDSPRAVSGDLSCVACGYNLRRGSQPSSLRARRGDGAGADDA